MKSTQSITKQNGKKEFDFNENHLAIVQNLLNKGFSYKKIARELSKSFVTARKHKRLTPQTIANLLQTYRNPRVSKMSHYTDSDTVHNPSEVKADSKTVQTEVIEIMKSNLSDELKEKCVQWALNS